MKIQDVIKGLQKPLSVPQDVDFRVGMSKSNGVSVLAYKDARVDMRRLDEVTNGQWQADYERDPKGTLKCGISIYVEMHDGSMQWLRKVSNGTESNTEQEKGQYSDAFKRAGFMWGIGRELYDMPFIWIKFEAGEDSRSVLRNMEWSVSGDYLIATKDGKTRYKGKLGTHDVPDQAKRNIKSNSPVINSGKPTMNGKALKMCIDGWHSGKEDSISKYLSEHAFTTDNWKTITGDDWKGGDTYAA